MTDLSTATDQEIAIKALHLIGYVHNETVRTSRRWFYKLGAAGGSPIIVSDKGTMVAFNPCASMGTAMELLFTVSQKYAKRGSKVSLVILDLTVTTGTMIVRTNGQHLGKVDYKCEVSADCIHPRAISIACVNALEDLADLEEGEEPQP